MSRRRALAHHLKGHTDAIYAVGFSPDGARAITGSDDKTLKLWSVPDGAHDRQPCQGHTTRFARWRCSGADGTIASRQR